MRNIVQAQIDSSNANKVCAKWSKNGNVDYTGVNLYVGFKSSVSSADDEGRKEITDTLNRKLNEYKQTYNASSMMITEYGVCIRDILFIDSKAKRYTGKLRMEYV